METITTSEPEKLPETVCGLLSEARPIPPGVAFFEQRFTLAALTGRLVSGLALLAVGVLLLPISLTILFGPHKNVTVSDSHDPEWWLVGASVVMCFAGWILIASVPACLALRRKQKAGERTRYGIFLTPEALVWRSYFDTTVIPHANVRGVENRTVRYTSSTGDKSFTLPMEWIGPEEPGTAIHAWSRSQTPPALPPVLPSTPPAL